MPGDCLFYDGEVASRLFIVYKGEVALQKDDASSHSSPDDYDNGKSNDGTYSSKGNKSQGIDEQEKYAGNSLKHKPQSTSKSTNHNSSASRRDSRMGEGKRKKTTLCTIREGTHDILLVKGGAVLAWGGRIITT